MPLTFLVCALVGVVVMVVKMWNDTAGLRAYRRLAATAGVDVPPMWQSYMGDVLRADEKAGVAWPVADEAPRGVIDAQVIDSAPVGVFDQETLDDLPPDAPVHEAEELGAHRASSAGE